MCLSTYLSAYFKYKHSYSSCKYFSVTGVEPVTVSFVVKDTKDGPDDDDDDCVRFKLNSSKVTFVKEFSTDVPGSTSY